MLFLMVSYFLKCIKYLYIWAIRTSTGKINVFWHFFLLGISLVWSYKSCNQFEFKFSGKVRILHGPFTEKNMFFSVFHGFIHRFFSRFFHQSQKQAYFNTKYVSLYNTWDFVVAYYEREIGLIFSKHPKLKLIQSF